LALSTNRLNGGTGISRADGTALSRWDDRVGTLFDLLADYLITQNRSAVTHTDTTRLWLPNILIIILLAVLDAATCLLVVLFLTSDHG